MFILLLLNAFVQLFIRQTFHHRGFFMPAPKDTRDRSLCVFDVVVRTNHDFVLTLAGIPATR